MPWKNSGSRRPWTTGCKGKEFYRMKWEELAYSLLEARPNDAVKLALAVAEGKPPNLKGADLRALVELCLLYTSPSPRD